MRTHNTKYTCTLKLSLHFGLFDYMKTRELVVFNFCFLASAQTMFPPPVTSATKLSVVVR